MPPWHVLPPHEKEKGGEGSHEIDEWTGAEQETQGSKRPASKNGHQRHGNSALLCYRKHHEYMYSRGQTKPTNKNGNLLMASKVTRKCADMLREASGQISAKSHKPL